MNKVAKCQGAKITEITESVSNSNAKCISKIEIEDLKETKSFIVNEKKGFASFFKNVGKSIKGIFSSKKNIQNNHIYSDNEKKK